MIGGEIGLELEDRVAVITINRPEKRNALSVPLLDSLIATVGEASADDSVDVLILTGSGSAFCAGLDLREVATDGGALSKVDGEVSSPWPELTKPIIGAINGPAVTAGFELALHCDLLIASEHASFADTHVAVGVMPGGGLSVLLPRRIGFPRAIELSLTGRFVDSAEALHLGIVNRVVPHQDLLPVARNEALHLGIVNRVVPHQDLLPVARAVGLEIAAHDQHAVRSLLGSMRRIAAVDGEAAGLAVERATAQAWLRSLITPAPQMERPKA